MTKAALTEAITEAKRFLRKAEPALKLFGDKDWRIGASAINGSAKRSSMDLTRALAKMRKSQ